MSPLSAPPLLVYTVLRLGLFVVVLGIVSIFATGIVPLLLAAVISLALSYVLLRGPRERLAQQVADRLDPARRRPGRFARTLAEDAQAEDALAEDADADGGDGGATGRQRP